MNKPITTITKYHINNNLDKLIAIDQLPPAIIIIDELYINKIQLTKQFIAHILCKQLSNIDVKNNTNHDNYDYDNDDNESGKINVSNYRLCNICQSCLLLNTNNHPDLLIVDELPNIKNSSIGIDAIDDIIAFINFAPIIALKKIVLINNIHNISLNFANALLKILEEPPHYVIFILLANNIDEVLLTIKSRCYLYHIKNNQPQSQYHQSSTHDTATTFLQNLIFIENELIFIMLVTPNIENIFLVSELWKNKHMSVETMLELLVLWICDLSLYYFIHQTQYFINHQSQMVNLIPKINFDKLFQFYDALIYIYPHRYHSLHSLCQIENLLFKYQQIFIMSH